MRIRGALPAWLALQCLLVIAGQGNAQSLAGASEAARALREHVYEEGRRLVRSGDASRVREGLELWAGSRHRTDVRSLPDPRIGVEFLVAVTEHELEEMEPLAADIFYWGFTATPSEPGDGIFEAVLAEGRRTFRLVDSTMAETWVQVGRKDPTGLAFAVKRFWLERDPTPTTIHNERLIEHWGRIVHSRKEYAYNRSSPYETDDRGTMYVKYGEPDRIVRGNLGASQSELRRLGVPMEWILQYDLAPQYEIWRYGGLEGRDFTYFLFGNEDGTGPFRLVKGLHEIIPNSAKGSSPQNRFRNLRAQYYLEYLYYGDLARMGGPFARRQAELDRIWLGSGRAQLRESDLRANSFRYEDEDVMAASRPLPPVLSPLESAPQSALAAQAARMLDGTEPRLLVLAVSSPTWRPRAIEPGEESIALEAVSADHTAILRDGVLDEIGRARLLPAGEGGDLFSLEMIHPPALRHLTVAAEHAAARAADLDGEETVASRAGRLHFMPGPPLARYLNRPEVSDLILGIPPDPIYAIDDAPVPLLPATTFWRDDVLRAYFEIYHDARAPEGEAIGFDIRVRLMRRDPRALVDLQGEDPLPEPEPGRPSTLFSLESRGATQPHTLDFDLRNERPGPLWVVLEITEQATGKTRKRARAITLLER